MKEESEVFGIQRIEGRSRGVVHRVVENLRQVLTGGRDRLRGSVIELTSEPPRPWRLVVDDGY